MKHLQHHRVRGTLSMIALTTALACSSSWAQISSTPTTAAPATSDQTTKTELDAYLTARRAFEEENKSYWARVSAQATGRLLKRSKGVDVNLEDYILDPPPKYRGPPRPKVLAEPPPRPAFPVVPDFIKAAQEKYGFKPDLPAREIDYKRAYAKAALAAGVSSDQLLTAYIFETGGTSGYDTQAGLETKNPNAKPVSTALGYNQLLDGNSVELLDEQGERFIAILSKEAVNESATKAKRVGRKLPTLKKMMAFAKLVPNHWTDHDRWIGHRTLALTQEGKAIHALNLDVDIGPLLQIQKLVDSVNFAKRRGFPRAMTGSELELLNLMGDPRGLDAISTSRGLQTKVPTWNFFDADGYEANPVVKDKTIAQLIATIEDQVKKGINLSGAQQLRQALEQ